MAKLRKTESWFESSFAGHSCTTELEEVKMSRSKTEFLKPSTSAAGIQSERLLRSKRNKENAVTKVASSSNCLPWTDRFFPKSLSELAVHSKKVEEIEQWLSKNVGKAAFLLLTGISGCGKTAALRVLCNQLRYGIKEWNNSTSSIGKTYGEFDEGSSSSAPEFPFEESQTSQFSKFMHRADYGDLNLKGEDKRKVSENGHQVVVLVKDFPNAFYRDPTRLHDILRQYKKFGKRPVVFVMSESPASSEMSARKMFPVRVSEELNLEVISLNPLAPRFMIKRLKEILKVAGRSENQKLLTEIAELSGGDMRVAINSLQMTVGGEKHRCQSKKSQKVTFRAGSGRDQTMLLFSALGKFLYSKRVEEFNIETAGGELPTHLSEKYRPLELSFDPEDVISRSFLVADSFVSFLHENYLKMFLEEEIGGAANACNDLSVADSLSGDWSTKYFGGAGENYLGSIAGRSIAFNNPDDHVLKHQKFLMRRPRWKDVAFEVNKSAPELKENFIDWRHSTSELVTELVPYLKLANFDNFRSERQWQIVKKLGNFEKFGGILQRESSNVLNRDGMDYISQERSHKLTPKKGKSSEDENVTRFVDIGEGDGDYVIEEYSDSD